MKLVQVWKNNSPALGIRVIDVTAERARRGLTAPGTMAEAIAMGESGLDLLKELSDGAECFTDAPWPRWSPAWTASSASA